MGTWQIYAVTLMGLFYFMATLDRNNLGNANIAGMSEELGLTGNQFGTAVTLLYVAKSRHLEFLILSPVADG